MAQERTTGGQKLRNTNIRKLFEAFSIGIWGAIIWGIIGILIHWFNLSKVSPIHISKIFLKEQLIFKWQGILIAFLLLTLCSILFSLIYVFLFSRFYTHWIGIVMGAILWAVTLGWQKLGINSMSATFCLFILYGAFIGYSLSVEFSSLEKNQS